MNRVKINLVTMSDAIKFSSIAEKFNFAIKVKDATGNCVNAKSLMGMIYCLEFNEMWCESEEDIYSAIKEFVVE